MTAPPIAIFTVTLPALAIALMSTSEQQVVINFRLDELGRTIPGVAHVTASAPAAADDDSAERKTTAQ